MTTIEYIQLPEQTVMVRAKKSENPLFEELTRNYKQNLHEIEPEPFKDSHPILAALETIQNYIDNHLQKVEAETLIPLLHEMAKVMADQGFNKRNFKGFAELVQFIHKANGFNGDYLMDTQCLKALCTSFLGLFLSDEILGTNRKDLKIRTAILTYADTIDDWLIQKGFFQSKWRACILERMLWQIQHTPVSYFYRHTDLAITFKMALYYLESDEIPFKIKGFDLLKGLPEKISSRIDITYDGRGEGKMPSGHAVFERRWAGHFHEIPYLKVKAADNYRNLHRLLAQSYYELGRAYTLLPIGNKMKNLSQAIECFCKSKKIYLELKKPDSLLASHCLIAETQTRQKRASLIKNKEEQLKEFGELYRLFAEVAKLLEPLEKEGDKSKKLSIERLKWLSFAFSLPGFDCITHLQARMNGEAALESQRKEILKICQNLLDKAIKDKIDYPWNALAYILSFINAASQEILNKKSVPSGKYTADSYFKEYAGEILLTFLDAIQAAQNKTELFPDTPLLKKYRSREDALQDESPDIRIPRSQPVNALSIMYSSIYDTFTTSGFAGTSLNFSQWMILLPWIRRIIPGNFPVISILKFQDIEYKCLRESYEKGTMQLSETVEYVRQRVEGLEEQIMLVYYSRSEKILMSQAVTNLVIHIRNISDDFRNLDCETALYFLDRQGASVFRANLPLYQRATLNTWSELADQQRILDDFSEYQSAYEHLGYYETRCFPLDEKKFRHKEFLKDLVTPSMKRHIFHHEGDNPEEIFHRTEVPPEKWDYVNGKIYVKVPTPSYEQAVQKVDYHRRAVIEAFEYLHKIVRIDETTLSPPKTDAQEVLHYLKRHPQRVCIYVGSICLGIPLSIFYTDGQRLKMACLQADPKNRKDMEAHVGFGVYITGWAFQLPERRIEEAFEKIVQESGKILATKLLNLMQKIGKNEIIFVRNTIFENRVPWESLPLDDGRLLCEVFPIAHVFTLAQIPSVEDMPMSYRRITMQIAGTGKSKDGMALGAGPMKHFSKIFKHTRFMEGKDFKPWTQEIFEQEAITSRLRFFLHGDEFCYGPQYSRLVLHEGNTQTDNQNLSANSIFTCPFNDMECVEIFACEASSMGRSQTEFGWVEEPDGISTAFLYAGTKRILSARYTVPFLPTALIMERYVLELEQISSEIRALSNARVWFRKVFAPGGACDKILSRSLSEILLPHKGDADFFAKSEQLERIKNESLIECIYELRVKMYEEFGYPAPDEKISLEYAKEPLLGIGGRPDYQKRHHRIAQGMLDDPQKEIAAMVEQKLTPFRNPLVYSGWQITLLDKENFR